MFPFRALLIRTVVRAHELLTSKSSDDCLNGLPAGPGGQLKSKSACSKAQGAFGHAIFLLGCLDQGSPKETTFMGTLEIIVLVVVLLFLFGGIGGGGYYWSRRR